MSIFEKCPFCGTINLTGIDEKSGEYTSGLRVKRGGANEQWQAVTCDRCGAQGPQASGKTTAVKFWNERI